MKIKSVFLLVCFTVLFFIWKSSWWNSLEPNRNTPQIDEAARFRQFGPLNLKSESVIGKPISNWEEASFDMAFVGIQKAPSRIEAVRLPRPDGSDAELDVRVFYGPSGQPIRYERTAKPNWKRLWTKQDLEGIMKPQLEIIHGVSGAPLPKSWREVFESLRPYVDFYNSVHFDATWVDFEHGERRRPWFIINDFADPSKCPDDEQERDKKRILIFPGEGALRFDMVL